MSKLNMNVMTTEEKQSLLSSLSNIYPDALLPFSEQPNIIETATYVKMSGETFAMCHCHKFCRSSYILASWTDDTGNINLTGKPRPGQIQTIFSYNCRLNSTSTVEVKSVVMAYV